MLRDYSSQTKNILSYTLFFRKQSFHFQSVPQRSLLPWLPLYATSQSAGTTVLRFDDIFGTQGRRLNSQ